MGKPSNVIEMKSVEIRRIHNEGKKALYHFNQIIDDIVDVHHTALDLVGGVVFRRIRAVDSVLAFEDDIRRSNYRGWMWDRNIN